MVAADDTVEDVVAVVVVVVDQNMLVVSAIGRLAAFVDLGKGGMVDVFDQERAGDEKMWEVMGFVGYVLGRFVPDSKWAEEQLPYQGVLVILESTHFAGGTA